MARIVRRPLTAADIADSCDVFAEDSVIHSARNINGMFDPDSGLPVP